MDDLHAVEAPKAPPGRFSIPAVVAGFVTPILIWAISISGLSFLPSFSDLLWIEYPIANYNIEEPLDIEVAGAEVSDETSQMYVRYTPLEKSLVAAAAESKPDVSDRLWSYGGKRLTSEEVIATMKKNREAYADASVQPVELNCFNNAELGVQGAIFELYLEDPSMFATFNTYDEALTAKMSSYSPLTPQATQDDFSACIAFRQQVEDTLGPREK